MVTDVLGKDMFLNLLLGLWLRI